MNKVFLSLLVSASIILVSACGQESGSTDLIGNVLSIFKSKPGKQATDAYIALKRIQASTQVGVSMIEYGKMLIEAKTALNLFAENPDAKKHRELFEIYNEVMRHYGNAADIWPILVETSILFPKKALLLTDARATVIISTYPELGVPMESALWQIKRTNLFAEASGRNAVEMTAPASGGAVFEARYDQGPGITPSFGYAVSKFATQVEALLGEGSSAQPESSKKDEMKPESKKEKAKFLDIDVAMKHMWQRGSKKLDSARLLLGD